MGSVILVLLLVGFIALVIVAVIKQRQERDRFLSEGKIIIREDGFWDKKESFTLSGVTIKDLYDKIESIVMTDFRIRSEYQPSEQRIVFNWNLGVYSSWTGVLAQTSSGETNVFELLIVSYQVDLNMTEVDYVFRCTNDDRTGWIVRCLLDTSDDL